MTEREVIALAKSVRKAQEDFARDHTEWLLRCAIWRYGGSTRRQDIEDIVQETWLRIFRSWPDGATTPYNRKYLRGALEFAFLDFLRRRGTEAERGDSAEPASLPEGPAEQEQMPHGIRDQELENAIKQLPERQQQVIRVVYFERKSLAEFAHEEGISAQVAWNYHYLAKRRLKEILAQ